MTKLERLQEIERQAEELRKEIEAESSVDWIPKEGEMYWRLSSIGKAMKENVDDSGLCTEDKDRFNYFKSKEQAELASADIHRAMAIINACRQVDPDYEPDWSIVGAVRWTAMYDLKLKKWVISCEQYCRVVVACVSTEEKAQQVCELLTKWGVK